MLSQLIEFSFPSRYLPRLRWVLVTSSIRLQLPFMELFCLSTRYQEQHLETKYLCRGLHRSSSPLMPSVPCEIKITDKARDRRTRPGWIPLRVKNRKSRSLAQARAGESAPVLLNMWSNPSSGQLGMHLCGDLRSANLLNHLH
jgi:hypothetical protein